MRATPVAPWTPGTPKGEACTPKFGEQNSPLGHTGTVAAHDPKATL